MTKKRARIYTDGSALYEEGSNDKSSGSVGWAFIIVDDETNKIIRKGSGGHPKNTHNYGELVAIKEAMKMVQSSTVYRYFDLYSDSRYCIDGINTYMHTWPQSRIQRRPNGAVWMEVSALHKKLKSKMNFSWIPGHQGNEFNGIVDVMAKAAATDMMSKAVLIPKAIDFADKLDKEITIVVGENEKTGRLFSLNTIKNTIALQYDNGKEFIAYLENGNVTIKS